MFDFRRTLIALLLVTATSARADSPKITAVLTSSETELGRPVQLEITVTGARNLSPPDSIKADGLDIRYTGESQNFEMFNFKTSSSVTINYTVMPMKSGTFKIPPQMIRAGNQTLQTPELTLQVNESSSRSTRAPGSRAPAAQSAGEEKIAFAELIVPKKTAYIGEMIPVVIRVGFNSRARLLDAQAAPHITGQGFTTQKVTAPERSAETIEGRSYIVYTYKTGIAAAHTGNLEIGPAEMNAAVGVPQRAARPRHQPFDPFSDDIFNDPSFLDPFGTFLKRHDITVRSEPVELEVKALPPGAPPNFSGAVGNFIMTMQANPKRVQIGDPITINAAISGRGNFDRVNAPAFSDERGWHKYPPSAKFRQDDDVGISGEKTFEMVVSPTEKQTKIRPLTFAYFDPAKEKYVTLQSEATAIAVEGNAPAIAQSSAAPAAVAMPAAQKPADILYQINERGKIVRTFAPIYERREFWLAQLVPLVVVLGAGARRIQKKRAANRSALRTAAWNRESDALLRKLRHDQSPPREYFTDASRFVQLRTALKENVEPGSVDADTAARAFKLSEGRSESLRRLFAMSEELRYSGSANGSVSPQRREEALELIESLR